jgi:hypothetical protein
LGPGRVVQQPGQTTIAEAQAAVDEMGLPFQVMTPVIGEVYTFTK